MRPMLILVAALILGLVGGYGWFSMTASTVHPAGLPKATVVPIPASPEELPTEEDQLWTARSEDNQAAIAADGGPVEPAVPPPAPRTPASSNAVSSD